MDFDVTIWLLVVPLAFVAGWLASRADLRQLRIENRTAPKAYFKGLNHLLNEQQDQAIDAFIEAVQSDPDTSELHFALGNLFRRRGEYERAVRVHQHLLSRGDLKAADRDRAQHALALDYLKAGLLDRAEDALRKLEGTAHQAEARLALLALYERSRDWDQAAAVVRRLGDSDAGSFDTRLAHYLCEQAASLPPDQAEPLLRQAVAGAPGHPRALLALADLQQQAGRTQEALATLSGLIETQPVAVPLAALRLQQWAAPMAAAEQQALHAALTRVWDQAPGLDVAAALTALDDGQGGDWYARYLEREPSLVAATRWLDAAKVVDAGHHPHVHRALDHASRPLLRYRCAACGFEARQHFWQCPGCQAWDSFPLRRIEEL